MTNTEVVWLPSLEAADIDQALRRATARHWSEFKPQRHHNCEFRDGVVRDDVDDEPRLVGVRHRKAAEVTAALSQLAGYLAAYANAL